MMRTILKKLLIVQTVSNKDRKPRIGKGYFEAHRLNPYNPLSYLVVVTALVIGIVLFGLLGVWKQTDGNPFKWN